MPTLKVHITITNNDILIQATFIAMTSCDVTPTICDVYLYSSSCSGYCCQASNLSRFLGQWPVNSQVGATHSPHMTHLRQERQILQFV
jgi:hypothetical protein